MNIYDKKFVHFEWDDSLVDKKVVVSDLVSDIRRYVNSTIDTLSLPEVRRNVSDVHPFSAGDTCYRFCYYDPLLEYKVAFNAGYTVQYNPAGTDSWYRVESDSFVWPEDCEYRIVGKEDKPERITKRQLSRWLAQGNGEMLFKGHVINAVTYVYLLDEENTLVSDEILVRKWDDIEWHEPTIDYCFPETREKNE